LKAGGNQDWPPHNLCRMGRRFRSERHWVGNRPTRAVTPLREALKALDYGMTHTKRTGREACPTFYGIGTEIELETPTLLVAVMVNDCSMWTRSLVLLPLDKTKGIAIKNAPPKLCAAVL